MRFPHLFNIEWTKQRTRSKVYWDHFINGFNNSNLRLVYCAEHLFDDFIRSLYGFSSTSHFNTLNRRASFALRATTTATARSLSWVVCNFWFYLFSVSCWTTWWYSETFFRHFTQFFNTIWQPSTLVNAQNWDSDSHFFQTDSTSTSTSAHPNRSNDGKILNG